MGRLGVTSCCHPHPVHLPMQMNNPRAPDPRLLIVEEHGLDREGLLALFWLSGHMEAVAVRPEEAVRMARQFAPDVVLMDATLPEGAAFQVAQLIVSQCPTARLLFLDDAIRPENLRAALRLGGSGYWTKDASFEEIAEAVRCLAAGGTAFCPGAK